MSDKQLVSVLNALVSPDKRKELKALEPRGALPGKKAVALYVRPATTGSGGIASPLTEASAGTREYWPAGLLSSDGLFELPAIKKMNLTDANGEPVVIQLASPAVAP